MTLCAEAALAEGHGVFSATEGEGLLSPRVLAEVGKADLVVLPYPATRDGVHITATHIPFSALPLREGTVVVGGGIPCHFHRDNILFFDLARDERFLWQNARLTAEGGLSAALHATERGLWGVRTAVLGYGRIGKQLARLLARMGAEVTVYARRAAALAEAESEGFAALPFTEPLSLTAPLVFGTFPASVPTDIRVTKGALCYDLGGGLPSSLADGEGETVTVTVLRGVPGVFSPVGAAEVYFRALHPYLSMPCFPTDGEECDSPESPVVPTLAEGETQERREKV